VNNINTDYSAPVMLDEILIGNRLETGYTPADTINIILIIYVIISIFFILRIVFSLLSIYRLYLSSEKRKEKIYTLVVTKKEINPFSFGRKIFIKEQQLNHDELLQIISHEKTHITQFHTLDNFLSEVICAIFWINPAFWIIQRDLKHTHEYLADKKVIEEGFDISNYFMLLYNNSVIKRIGVVNNLNKSLTLKRLKMMKKEDSPRRLTWLYALAAPVFIAGIVSFTCVEANNINIAEKPEKTIVEPENVIIVEETDTIYNFAVVEEKPQFPGGEDALTQYLSNNIKYPDDLKKQNIQGRVYVQFVIDKKGKVTDVKVAKGEHPELNKLAINAVSAMPDWIPGKQDGKNVKVTFIIPISFSISEENE
jgi:TonB family protein